MTSDISAIIPVLGPEPLLQRAVDSALANPEIFELIVVDDGSPVPLKLSPDHKVRVIRHNANRGSAAARNTGAREAVCSWLAFLDADDIWNERKARVQIDALRSDNTGAIGAVCTFGFQRGGRSVICRPPSQRLEFSHALKGARFGLGSTMMISREAFLRSKGFDEDYRRYEDWEWLLRILQTGHFLTQQEQLVSISHGYRAKPDIALPMLSRLEQAARLLGLTPRQSKDFRAAVALERTSLLLSGRRPLAATWSILTAMRHDPVWIPQTIFNRLMKGSVPGH